MYRLARLVGNVCRRETAVLVVVAEKREADLLEIIGTRVTAHVYASRGIKRRAEDYEEHQQHYGPFQKYCNSLCLL